MKIEGLKFRVMGLKFRIMDKTLTIYENKRIKVWRKKDWK